MSSKKAQWAIVLTSASLLSLAGCTSLQPVSMPSGYTYHHQEYQAPPAASSARITTQQRHYMTERQATQFRDAVYDILVRVTQRAGIPPKPVYVLQPQNFSSFYGNIDNDLRESMRHLGYALSDMPLGAYVFTYDAMFLENTDGNYPENVEITLSVYDSLGSTARLLTRERGRYYIDGAEYLNIRPTKFKQNQLPPRGTVAKQAEGYSYEPQTILAPNYIHRPIKESDNPISPAMVDTPQPPPVLHHTVQPSPVVAPTPAPVMVAPTATTPVLIAPDTAPTKPLSTQPKAVLGATTRTAPIGNNPAYYQPSDVPSPVVNAPIYNGVPVTVNPPTPQTMEPTPSMQYQSMTERNRISKEMDY